MIVRPELPLHIDSTMLSCFRSCQKKFYWEFVRGLRPRALSADLHAGAVFASALERYYICVYKHSLPHDTSLAYAVEHFEELWGDYETPKYNPKSRDRMMAALLDYLATYPPHIDRFQPYVTQDSNPTFEFTFAIPLDFANFPRHPSGDPFIYSGRADALGSYDGLPCIRDEKTTKGIGDTWSRQWDLRGQFIGYCWAAQISGLAVEQVLVRGIGILKTEIKQIEALKQYPRHIIDNWLVTLQHDVQRLRKAWDAGAFDYNFGEACSAYGGCQFNPLCVAKDPEPWTTDYEVRHWNPLAKNPLEFTPKEIAA
jgi:hypothetical protein